MGLLGPHRFCYHFPGDLFTIHGRLPYKRQKKSTDLLYPHIKNMDGYMAAAGRLPC